MVRARLSKEERDRLLKIAGKKFAKVYLHLSLAIDDAEDGEMAVQKLGLCHTDIKYDLSRLMKDFDRFFVGFKKYIASGDSAVILRDFERLKPEIDKIFNTNL